MIWAVVGWSLPVVDVLLSVCLSVSDLLACLFARARAVLCSLYTNLASF